ncbi:hypothetical protein [Nocardia amamiensis]|uniref:hypothetical protein n=1 Tax=Nocardia amamiensis TaxID=404578 RepID=UPI00082E2918|nr:hypothetical protein [Nocardia amamiensis]
MSGGNERWRATTQLTTIAEVIDRYRRLNSLSEAMDMTAMDPSDERDQARHIYMWGVRHLLAGMVGHVPASDSDRRQALENVLGEPDTSACYGQSMDTLSRYWNKTRQDLDHDIADIAGVPLLLGMVRARDDVIADLEDQLADLRDEITDRIADINERDRQLAQPDSDRLITAAGLAGSLRADAEPGAEADPATDAVATPHLPETGL